MANEEHLAILKQGVEVWNEWRQENSSLKPNLIGANLSGADLRQCNFNKANLSAIDLSGANLTRATFREADLCKADFGWADLSRADLRKANLIGADLSRTDLSGSKFDGATLKEVNLMEADLYRADFSRVNLNHANLTEIKALGTNFTAANFTGVCLEDWHINRYTHLESVICDYVYLRWGNKERRPSIGNFAPGEFTQLFQKSLETVDLIFRNGVDWDAFAYSFKKVEVENQGAQLDVQSIEKKGDGILVVRVSVSPDADKAKIHGDFMQGYEFAYKALEAQYQARIEDKDKEINRLFYLLNKANEQLGEVPKLLAENPRKVSNYYQQNSQFTGGVVDAEIVQSHQIGGDIYNTTDNQESLD
jgi:hypothetical protein